MINNLTLKIRNTKRAGVSLPLGAIWNQNSYSIGDIYSLRVLSEWAKKSGITIIQILPLNDTGYGRSPYSSISAFAIDPIYISFKLLGIPDKKSDLKTDILDILDTKQKKIHILNNHFREKYYQKVDDDLDLFISRHTWTKEYICFTILNNQNKGIHWSNWDNPYSDGLSENLKKSHRYEYYFIAWMQKVAYEQLKGEKEKMELMGVYLKGDMPILTSDHSADVWARPELFNRELTSGAPPDYFNSQGQNWGFPVIDWKHMKKQEFSWWKERLDYLGNFYHLYRIDHVLGMYRIWAIPRGKESAKFGFFHPQRGVSRKEFNLVRLFPEDFEKLNLIYEFKQDHYIFYWDFFKTPEYQSLPEEVKARFYPLSALHLSKDEEHWRKAGDEILKFLFENSSMVPCAEDLGAVPSFVRDSIHEFQLLGLDIIRWTRSFEDGSYIKPEGYRKNAVSALSVHDTSSAHGWWTETSDEERKAFRLLFPQKENSNSIKKEGKTVLVDEPKELPSDIPEILLGVALGCASQYSIHMLQDYIISGKLGEDRYGMPGIITRPLEQRINVPGTPEDKNWKYTFPFLAEELLDDTELSKRIHDLIQKSGRAS